MKSSRLGLHSDTSAVSALGPAEEVVPLHDHASPGTGGPIPEAAIALGALLARLAGAQTFAGAVQCNAGLTVLTGLTLTEVTVLNWILGGKICTLDPPDAPSDGRAWTLPDFSAALGGVVASVSLAGQTASIATTNLLAAAPAGLYRVSIFQQTTTAAAAGTLTTTIGWTDDVGAASATPAAGLTVVGTGRDYGMAFLRHAGGGAAITYACALAGVVGSPVYRIDIALERLS